MHDYSITPIGFIASCYKEKFGIPRQPRLVNTDETLLVLNEEYSNECVRGLEGFTHIWVTFIFHATQEQGWKPMVRPPRLGGNKKIGVFASRSTFRPNSLGLSAVELLKIEQKGTTLVLHLKGGDFLDRTPVVDIKPYLPYSDSIVNASGGFAPNKPDMDRKVIFNTLAKKQCRDAEQRLGQDLFFMIKQILGLDPRPSYQTKQERNINRVYAMKLFDFDLKWQYCENSEIKVVALEEQKYQ